MRWMWLSLLWVALAGCAEERQFPQHRPSCTTDRQCGDGAICAGGVCSERVPGRDAGSDVYIDRDVVGGQLPPITTGIRSPR